MIELLITVAIVALLATSAVALVQNTVTRSKEADLRADLREIRTAIDAYKAASDAGHIAHSIDASGYPPNLRVLVAGVADAKSPTRTKLFFLRRLPFDPMADTTSPDADGGNWALRSYASDPENPQPGADVFDVSSTSDKIGLNGVPYNRW